MRWVALSISLVIGGCVSDQFTSSSDVEHDAGEETTAPPEDAGEDAERDSDAAEEVWSCKTGEISCVCHDNDSRPHQACESSTFECCTIGTWIGEEGGSLGVCWCGRMQECLINIDLHGDSFTERCPP